MSNDPAATIRGQALLFAMVFPTVLTWVYFDYLAGHDGSQVAYGIGKTIQFGFPLFWLIAIRKQAVPKARWTSDGLGFGVVFGVVVSIAMLLLYHGLVADSEVGRSLQGKVLEKVSELGLHSKTAFLGLLVFYSACHSGLEEYYWRWFVFRGLKQRLGLGKAIVLSSLGFMAHHVLLLSFFFEDEVGLTLLFSLCVGVGGAVWAWLYHRTGNPWAIWLSHGLVDVGIFLIGYQICF